MISNYSFKYPVLSKFTVIITDNLQKKLKISQTVFKRYELKYVL